MIWLFIGISVLLVIALPIWLLRWALRTHSSLAIRIGSITFMVVCWGAFILGFFFARAFDVIVLPIVALTTGLIVSLTAWAITVLVQALWQLRTASPPAPHPPLAILASGLILMLFGFLGFQWMSSVVEFWPRARPGKPYILRGGALVHKEVFFDALDPVGDVSSIQLMACDPKYPEAIVVTSTTGFALVSPRGALQSFSRFKEVGGTSAFPVDVERDGACESQVLLKRHEGLTDHMVDIDGDGRDESVSLQTGWDRLRELIIKNNKSEVVNRFPLGPEWVSSVRVTRWPDSKGPWHAVVSDEYYVISFINLVTGRVSERIPLKTLKLEELNMFVSQVIPVRFAADREPFLVVTRPSTGETTFFGRTILSIYDSKKTRIYEESLRGGAETAVIPADSGTERLLVSECLGKRHSYDCRRIWQYLLQFPSPNGGLATSDVVPSGQRVQ